MGLTADLLGALIYEINIGIIGHRVFVNPGASYERKILKKYGVIGWETAFFAKIMGALGANEIVAFRVSHFSPIEATNIRGGL